LFEGIAAEILDVRPTRLCDSLWANKGGGPFRPAHRRFADEERLAGARAGRDRCGDCVWPDLEEMRGEESNAAGARTVRHLEHCPQRGEEVRERSD
jgi:hypothetical protein